MRPMLGRHQTFTCSLNNPRSLHSRVKRAVASSLDSRPLPFIVVGEQISRKFRESLLHNIRNATASVDCPIPIWQTNVSIVSERSVSSLEGVLEFKKIDSVPTRESFNTVSTIMISRIAMVSGNTEVFRSARSSLVFHHLEDRIEESVLLRA